ncbi:hypothetical protein VCR15J2_20297 [Vibrio coralliirubri]|nr:hypothetical protein VCR15J2_20297 [Vibrio coralliirubri]
MLSLLLVCCLLPKPTELKSHRATLFSAQQKANNATYSPNTKRKITALKQGRNHEQIIRNIRTERPRTAKPRGYGTHDTRSY